MICCRACVINIRKNSYERETLVAILLVAKG